MQSHMQSHATVWKSLYDALHSQRNYMEMMVQISCRRLHGCKKRMTQTQKQIQQLKHQLHETEINMEQAPNRSAQYKHICYLLGQEIVREDIQLQLEPWEKTWPKTQTRYVQANRQVQRYQERKELISDCLQVMHQHTDWILWEHWNLDQLIAILSVLPDTTSSHIMFRILNERRPNPEQASVRIIQEQPHYGEMVVPVASLCFTPDEYHRLWQWADSNDLYASTARAFRDLIQVDFNNKMNQGVCPVVNMPEIRLHLYL